MKELIKNLLHPRCYDHPVSSIQLIKTNSSWAILPGLYASKIKKTVDFSFLDYSTLEKRHYFCERAIALNSGTATDLYIGVVPIAGPIEAPGINANAEPIGYAIKMNEFAQHELGDQLMLQNKLTTDHCRQLAQLVARFHAEAMINHDDRFGTASQIYMPVQQNFLQINEKLEVTYRLLPDEYKPRFDRIKMVLDANARWADDKCESIKIRLQ